MRYRRVLVVCKSNATRSQIAGACIKKRFPSLEVHTRGTDVEKEHRQNAGVPRDIVQDVAPFGIDLSRKVRRQLTREDARWADRIIVTMLPRQAEKHFRPLVDELGVDEGKVEYWPVEDMKWPRARGVVAERTAEIWRFVEEWMPDGSRERPPRSARTGDGSAFARRARAAVMRGSRNPRAAPIWP